MTLLNNVFNLQ